MKIDGGFRLTTTAKICVGDTVNLIADADLEKSVSELSPKQKIKIELKVESGKPITATAFCKDKKVLVKGELVQPAINRPTSKDEIIDNFKKSKYFDCDIDFSAFDEVFIVKSSLNEFRRKVFIEMENALTKVDRNNLELIHLKKPSAPKKFSYFTVIEDLDKIEEVTTKNVVYSPENYEESDVLAFKSKCEQLNKCAYLDTPNFATSSDIILLKEIIEKSGISIVANNYYALSLSNNYVVGGGLNVYNSYTASLYNKEIISAESDVGEREDFAYMTLRHCPIKEHDGGSCEKCRYVKGEYSLKCEDGKVMRIKRKKLKTCTFYLTK